MISWRRENRSGGALAHPVAGNGRHTALTYGFIIGFTSDTDQGLTGGAFPDRAHALGRVAAPALALGILGENATIDLRKVILMEPRLAHAHDE